MKKLHLLPRQQFSSNMRSCKKNYFSNQALHLICILSWNFFFQLIDRPLIVAWPGKVVYLPRNLIVAQITFLENTFHKRPIPRAWLLRLLLCLILEMQQVSNEIKIEEITKRRKEQYLALQSGTQNMQFVSSTNDWTQMRTAVGRWPSQHTSLVQNSQYLLLTNVAVKRF